MPYVNDVHVDQALTTISVAYENGGFVADTILPPAPVDKLSDLYFVYGREPFKLYGTRTRPGDPAAEFVWSLSKASYSAERYALRSIVVDAVRQQADSPLNMDIDTTQMLTDAIQNQREYDVLNTVTTPANVPQNLALATTSMWSDYTNSTPLSDLRAAKSAVRMGVLKEATDLTTSFDVGQVLADHPSVKDLIKYTDPQSLQTSGLPNVVRGLKINIASAFYDKSNVGQPGALGGTTAGVTLTPTPTMANMISNNALIHYTAGNPGLKTVSFGYRFEAPDPTTGMRGFSTMRYRDEARHGDWIEVATTYTLKVIAPLAAFLYTNCV